MFSLLLKDLIPDLNQLLIKGLKLILMISDFGTPIQTLIETSISPSLWGKSIMYVSVFIYINTWICEFIIIKSR